MPHAPGEGPSLWDRARERPRNVLMALLAGVVAVGGVVPWLILVDTWRGSGDPGMFPDLGEAVPRALVMADMLQYMYFSSATATVPPLSMVAAAALLALVAQAREPDLSAGGRRAAVLLVVVVTVAATVAVAVRLGLVLYAKTSVPEELVGIYFSPSTGIGSALALLGPFAELLAWSVVLRLGLACWSVEEVEDLHEADEVEEVDRAPAPEVGHGLPEREDLSPPEPPREWVDPARLRPDGSSDSGFDEFHFRR